MLAERGRIARLFVEWIPYCLPFRGCRVSTQTSGGGDGREKRDIHLPVHASWLNQIEIVFSILQRKVLSPNDLTDLSQLADRIAAFEGHFNADARPFDWRFTRADLADFLKRLAAHEDLPSAVA